MSSLCRASDLFATVAPAYGESGMCPANGMDFSEDQKRELLLWLNQSIPMLMKRIDGVGSLARWTVPVWGGEFSLPPDCVDLRQAFLNGCALELRDQWFEGRIGYKMSDCNLWCGGHDLIDIGDGYAIPELWSAHIQDARYGLMAEVDEDAGTRVQVKLKDRYGNVETEFLELLPNQQLVQTEHAVTDILFQHKGVTRGAVVGFTTFVNGTSRRILRIPANVPSPTYHRKRLPASFSNCTGELSIIGKMRFTPLTSEFDTLPICDGAALYFGFRAVAALRRNDPSDYNTQVTLAVNELQKVLQDVHPTAVVTQMAVKSPLNFHRRCFN
jgi:hypothetical protein